MSWEQDVQKAAEDARRAALHIAQDLQAVDALLAEGRAADAERRLAVVLAQAEELVATTEAALDAFPLCPDDA